MFIVTVATSHGGHGDHTDVVGTYTDLADAVERAAEPWNEYKTMSSLNHGVYIWDSLVDTDGEAELIYARRYAVYGDDGVPRGSKGWLKDAEWFSDEHEIKLRVRAVDREILSMHTKT